MKKWSLAAAMGVMFMQTCLGEVSWSPDLPSALLEAPRDNRVILLDFTGSDWCGWCKKLKREVFDQPEFEAYAKKNLVMVEVDFPRHKTQSASERAANKQLAEKYGIHGYPTIIVLDASGNKIGQGGYVEGGPKNFIAALEQFPGVGHRESAPVAASKAVVADEPRPAPPVFVPIPPSVPNQYGDLLLKGISGAKEHRMAMINNATLVTGETGSVKVHDQRVQVTLKEVHDDSVLIEVGGKTQELKLGMR